MFNEEKLYFNVLINSRISRCVPLSDGTKSVNWKTSFSRYEFDSLRAVTGQSSES